MSHAIYLSDDERAVNVSAVRAAIKHADKTRAGLIARFGDAADTTGADARLALLEAVYAKLGKDPSMIEGR